MAEISVKSRWDGTKLYQTVEMEVGWAVNEASIRALQKSIAEAMVEEMAKSPEFQKGVRDLAVKRIIKLLEEG